MVKGSIYRERTMAWYVVACLAFVAIGGGLLYLAELEFFKNFPKLRSVVSNLGGLTIASLGLGVVWELFGKRALVQEVFESASVSREVQAARIFGVTTQFQEGVKWSELLADAHELEMMISIGKTWRNTFDYSLAALAARPNSKITLVFPDPHDEDVMDELARRFSMSPEMIRRSIEDNEKYFKELVERNATKRGCTLSIWHLSEAPFYTFYRIDETYVLTTYRHGRKGNIPTLVCRKGGCIADFIEEQKSLMMDKQGTLARKVYPSAVKASTTQIDTESIPESGGLESLASDGRCEGESN